MTQLTQTRQRPAIGFVGAIALAAALFGGIVGSGIQSLIAGIPARNPGVGVPTVVVPQSAIAWEALKRQMDPDWR